LTQALALEGKSGPGAVFDGVSTDSRTIRPGQLFVALAGESFDGHDYIPDMIGRGIRGFVVRRGTARALEAFSRSGSAGDRPVFFEVDETLAALGSLARYHRLRSGVHLVAITGSNGKTSTREMTAAIFAARYRTLSTRGNLNNEIGLPLTLLGLSNDHQWAVVEMGMSHPGEIARLGAIALPDIGVITNTAECHLEGLGSVTNVALAKAELLATLVPGAVAVLNQDDPRRRILIDEASKNTGIARVVWFGTGPGAPVTARDIRPEDGRIRFTLVAEGSPLVEVRLNVPAPFMVANALAASSAALAAGIDPAGIKAGLEAFAPVTGRMATTTLPEGIHLINDTYNANPGSMAGALETLALLSRGAPGVAVLGDMLELGPESERLHREMGRKVVDTGVSRLYVYGVMGRFILEGALDAGFAPSRGMAGTKDEILRRLLLETFPGTWVLVKGSRGMRMEEIIDGFTRGRERQRGGRDGDRQGQGTGIHD
jgi:UDP-N-acetylmuramoyl-tripeptide--D-alanyl-D-alanine ligase